MSDSVSELTGTLDKKLISDNINELAGNVDKKPTPDMFKELESFLEDQEYKGFLSLFIKAQIYITKLFDKLKYLKEGHIISRLAASSTLFFIPSYVSGYWLQEKYDYKIMTYSLILTLFWGLISPFLLLYAATILNKLFKENKNKFNNETEWEKIYFHTLKNFFSQNNLLLGLAWSVTAASIVTFVYFSGADPQIKAWALVSSFYLSFISSLGFHGINTIANMMDNIFSLKNSVLNFDVNHPDNFGGFLNFNSFLVRATLLFSSGTLVIPIGFDICSKCNNDFYTYLTVLLVLYYILVIGDCFFTPLLRIKKFVIDEKERLICESLDKLHEMMHYFVDDNKKDLYLKDSLHILIQYQITRLRLERLEKIKTNPWNFKSLSEFSFSVLVPSIVTIIQLKEKL